MIERIFKYTANKYELASNEGAFALDMPAGARVILAGQQHGEFCVWAIVDPDRVPERREFLLRGTGHPLPTNVVHIGSFLQNEGEFVWHLFAPKDDPNA